ncbi:MAG: DNA polymerase I [Chlamydiae bacterium]|nr:DNA polymerase I [Chlamydiota bacterium]
MKKIFILDSFGYLFRSYYAIRNLSRKTGESTNALYGFVRAILKIIKDFEPTHLVAVFDGPNNTKARSAIFPEYKSNRLHPPEDLPHQFEWAYQFCELANIPRIRVDETEADDAMATIALWAASQGSEAYICTSDKDLFQLVSDRIFILNTHKNNLIYDSQGVKDHFGVWPTQILDYLSIVGDASDNIPGVKSFGPKTAQSLLEKATSLDELIKAPEKYLNDKKREVFVSQLDQLAISRKLITLFTDVETPTTPDFYELKKPEAESLMLFYEDMNFNTLLREHREQGFKNQKGTSEKIETTIVQDLSVLSSLVEELSKQKEICIDTETTGLDRLQDKIIGIGIGYQIDRIWYIPLNGRLDAQDVIKMLKPLLENPNIGFYGHHLKYDLHLLSNHGVKVSNISGDTMIMSYLLSPHLRQHSLDHLSLEHFNHQKISIKEILGKGKEQKNMNDIPIDQVAPYCGEDIWMTIRLKELFKKELSSSKLTPLYQDIELPLVDVLFKMERSGIYIDTEKLHQMAIELKTSLTQIEEETYALAGEKFNLKSPKQLGEILYTKLEITPTKKTKTGYSTNAETLELLQDAHPIVEKILNFRLLEKLRSTYVESLVDDVNPQTKRIHCNFNQTITATGRLSCQNPNLQNIPVRAEEGKKIREAFKPQFESRLFLAADYSQIELRLLAHFSEDPTLLQTFKNNLDVHAQTASDILNTPLDQITKEQRYLAKAVNFGILYGQQAFGLSKQLKISVKEAKSFIEKYFNRYSNVQDYLEFTKEEARKKGYAETLFGRRRPLPEINSQNKLLKQAAERLAVNSPIQGSNADIIKIAMIKIQAELEKKKQQTSMLLQIHDELLFEVPKDELLTLQELVKEKMENVIELKVPLTVDIKIGKNWKEC